MSGLRVFVRSLCLIVPFALVGCGQSDDVPSDDSQPLSREERGGAVSECADVIVKGGYYVASRGACYVAYYACPPGHEDVWNACGCGCVPTKPGSVQARCPDPRRKDVHYVSHDLGVCMQRMFVCGPGETWIPSECGCGCMPHSRLTPEACEASGGQVMGDPGNGVVHGPEYRCPSGAAPSGTILTAEGEPFGIEGAVCCPL
jgi:hypothetical protein